MKNVIEISGLTKDYESGFWEKKRVRALDNLTLSVRGGIIFGFLGVNGAGKTTTIKLLMRLIFPTAGTATILGRDISNVDMHQLIGYCPENPYFYDYLTPQELLDHFGRLFGLSSVARRQRTEELLADVGLEEATWNKQLRKFSKGMLQRVALAQSLIGDPKIVFMDEPMSGLDPIGRRDVRELIAGLRDSGVTVFMSTHILSDVEALCEEVAILDHGRLVATGSLHDLLTHSEVDERFEVTFRGFGGSAESTLAEIGAVLSKGDWLTVTVSNENEVEKALRAGNEAGLKLVSVHPVRRSLEDLFVSKTKQ